MERSFNPQPIILYKTIRFWTGKGSPFRITPSTAYFGFIATHLSAFLVSGREIGAETFPVCTILSYQQPPILDKP